MKIEKNVCGFERAEFVDDRDEECSIQQSSAIDGTDRGIDNPGSSFLWLGPESRRMHLDREQAKELAEMMLRWAETGSLEGKGNL